MELAPGEITLLLHDPNVGTREAAETLIPLVYAELRRLAGIYMGKERRDHTLQPTALVNEAFLRLTRQDPKRFQNRSHFFCVAASVMRHILVDYARQYRASKRAGAYVSVPLNEALVFSCQRSEELLGLDQALTRLAALDPTQCLIVELRFFGGLTELEISELLAIPLRTIKREWSTARAWLHLQIRSTHDTGSLATH